MPTRGVPLGRLAVLRPAGRAWTGLEFAHGIPGTLGGAVVHERRGLRRRDARRWCTEVTCLDAGGGIRPSAGRRDAPWPTGTAGSLTDRTAVVLDAVAGA
ncbi:MAG: hypothetical protein ACLSHM_01430 [Vescimonas sp.]